MVIDPREWDWAGYNSDDEKLITRINVPTLAIDYWKPLSRIWRSKEFPSQDEFKKRSPYCTAYAAMNAYNHWFGKPLAKRYRREFVKYCLDYWYIYDTEDRKGGNTIKTATAFVHWFNSKNFEYEAAVNYVEAGSNMQGYLQLFGGYWFVSSFIINEWFIKDRADNKLLDSGVHWGKKYNGHAIFEARVDKDKMLVINNYPSRDKKWTNHFGIVWRDARKKYYDREYHRKYSALITFKKRKS